MASADVRSGSQDALNGWATTYGASYEGQPLGCGGGVYQDADPGIIAVGPARYSDWPCGTVIRVCGAAGCIVGTRQDACPGCSGTSWVDLSGAGIAAVCGADVGSCAVTVEALR